MLFLFVRPLFFFYIHVDLLAFFFPPFYWCFDGLDVNKLNGHTFTKTLFQSVARSQKLYRASNTFCVVTLIFRTFIKQFYNRCLCTCLEAAECFTYLKLFRSKMLICSVRLFNLEATAVSFGVNVCTVKWCLVAAYSRKISGSRHITFLPLPFASIYINCMEIELHCIACIPVVTVVLYCTLGS